MQSLAAQQGLVNSTLDFCEALHVFGRQDRMGNFITEQEAARCSIVVTGKEHALGYSTLARRPVPTINIRSRRCQKDRGR